MKITLTKPQKQVKEAVNKYLEFISPTYGPAGKNILIALNEFNVKAVDDGHEASKEFEIENEFENAIISYIKESTNKTNSRVGDGTTTAVILTSALVNEVMSELDDPFADTNYFGQVLEIRESTKKAVEAIREKAKKIKTKQELYEIAYNSYNNEEIAHLIADTIFKIGMDGILTIEDSQTAKTEIEMVEGLELQKGYASPYFITNEKEEAILVNPSVVLVNKRIDSFLEVVPLIKNLIESGKREIIVVADGFSDDALNNFILAKIKGQMSVILVEVTGDKLENLTNIAAVTNSMVIDPKVDKLDNIPLEYIGQAKKVIATKDKTTIIGTGKESIAKRVKILESIETTNDYEKEKIIKQIAQLKGGIALLKVGANTEHEQQAIKAKVEDSVNATLIAFRDGVVKGAGKTYAELKTGSNILDKALKAPQEQLEKNGAKYLDENVIDPAGVLIAALETASSIACGLLSIGGVLATKRKPEKD